MRALLRSYERRSFLRLFVALFCRVLADASARSPSRAHSLHARSKTSARSDASRPRRSRRGRRRRRRRSPHEPLARSRSRTRQGERRNLSTTATHVVCRRVGGIVCVRACFWSSLITGIEIKKQERTQISASLAALRLLSTCFTSNRSFISDSQLGAIDVFMLVTFECFGHIFLFHSIDRFWPRLRGHATRSLDPRYAQQMVCAHKWRRERRTRRRVVGAHRPHRRRPLETRVLIEQRLFDCERASDRARVYTSASCPHDEPSAAFPAFAAARGGCLRDRKRSFFFSLLLASAAYRICPFRLRVAAFFCRRRVI